MIFPNIFIKINFSTPLMGLENFMAHSPLSLDCEKILFLQIHQLGSELHATKDWKTKNETASAIFSQKRELYTWLC